MPAPPSTLDVQAAPPGASEPSRQIALADRRPAPPGRLVRPALIVTSCAVAFLPGATRLAASTPSDYPLLGAVASLVLSGALAARRLSTPAPGPHIHDRQVDYIVAVGLLVGALVLIAVKADHSAPIARSWPEVLALPFYCGGVLSIAYGVRLTARLRGALATLLLAWPPVLVPLARAAKALFIGGASLQVAGLVAVLATAGWVALHLAWTRRVRQAGELAADGTPPSVDAVPRRLLALSVVLAVGLLAGALDAQVGSGSDPAPPAVAGVR